MAQANRTFLFFFLVLIVSGLLTLNVAIDACYPGASLVHEPLHSGLEAFGAMSALVVAIFLLQASERGGQPGS